jgi:synaptic vesicle membrane protein VAT-1
MQAIVIERAGGYERLQVRERQTPEPKAGEVRVAVKAIGVNYADCLVRRGLYASATEFVGWPITPGFEVAGTVEAVGDDVDWRVGQEVIVVTLFGGYATHVVVPQRQVFDKPAALSWGEAAALPTVGLTAYYALFELVHPHGGDWLLVHSAAGGVGSMLVQLGKIANCHVVGVVGSSHKTESVRRLGADHVIDKSKEDMWPTVERIAPNGYSAIFDANGPATLKQSYAHLAAPGKLVIYGFHTMLPRGDGFLRQWRKIAAGWLRTPRFDPLHMVTANRSVLAFNLSYQFSQGELLQHGMKRLFDWIETGRICLPAVREYPLADVAVAHKDLESGQTTGKLVLLV